MNKIAGFIIRSSAFVSKELVEILRQTRLLLALVLGPFLILLLFGLGFRNEARELRTLFVIPADNETLRVQVQDQATTLGPQLDFQGAVADEDEALRRLAAGRVDAVAIIPNQVEERIRNSEQPIFRIYHREIDPIQVSYVQYVAQIYIDELNRRVLQNIAVEGQREAADVQDELQAAKNSARAMREAFERDDVETAQRQRNALGQSMDAIALSVGASLGVLQGVEQTMGSAGDNPGSGAASEILGTLDAISGNNQELESTETEKDSYSEEAERAAEIEGDLTQLETQLADFRNIDANVLVSPFKAEALSLTEVELTSSEFFAPGVIVLLLQHLAVTFAALSIVRERISGTMELFRVAPITSLETLLGKYISYLLLGALLAAGISALVVLVLRVPMLGSWGNYAIVLFAVLFAALGAGFIISLLSETTSQAVQYSMLLLLFSIFFSGFFLDLRLMWESLRFLAWSIPATYGMRMLQEIMFRANPIDPLMLGGLLGIGVLLFLISWFLLRRQMRLF
jgi:ABC-2 type transport system permease protein